MVDALQETEYPPQVAIAELVELVGRPTSVEGVLSDRLEEVIATAGVVELHEALVDESTEQVERLVPVELVVGDDGCDGIGREAGDEHAEPAQQLPLVVAQQVVAPIDRRQQRLVTGAGPLGPRR